MKLGYTSVSNSMPRRLGEKWRLVRITFFGLAAYFVGFLLFVVCLGLLDDGGGERTFAENVL
jgi:hypothetical protein